MPEQLPVPLELSRPANVVARRRHLDDLDVYGSLSDFQQLMLQTWATDGALKPQNNHDNISKKFLWIEVDSLNGSKKSINSALINKGIIWNSFVQMSWGFRKLSDKLFQMRQFGGIASDVRTKPSYL